MRRWLRRNTASALFNSSNANMAAACLPKQQHAAAVPSSEVVWQQCVGSCFAGTVNIRI